LDDNRLQKIRGSRIGMIFQDPLTSLNPVFSIYEQMVPPLMIHQGVSEKTAKEKAVAMLNRVGIMGASRRIKEFPHQFSGGQRQRIAIAMALCLEPEILIADEPTTALDVSIQAQVLEILIDLQKQMSTSMLFISHNLGVVSGIAHRVAVMYAGWIVEEAPAKKLFENPRHPYTRALINAIPLIKGPGKELKSLPGQPPSAGEIIRGCRLHPRCPDKIDGLCDSSIPEYYNPDEDHKVRCFLYADNA